MIKVGIIGATGYTGSELIRLLLNHKDVEIKAITSSSKSGDSITEIFPSFIGYSKLKFLEHNAKETISICDVVFVALPHGHSASIAKEVKKQNKIMIDLGADFRLKNFKTYEQWYGIKHSGVDLLKEAVYALPELYRNEIKGKKIIANPGCYVTSVLLALTPLLKNNLISEKGIIVDAKSGLSGAGKNLSSQAHFVNVNENMDAYKIATHRHTPEIEQELTKQSEKEVILSFTPHHIPITRGILSTIYADLKEDVSEEFVKKAFDDMYKDEPFVHLLPSGIYPQIKWVAGSNNCHINFKIDKRTNKIIIVSVIDNLIKGASGQAIQNMNILFGKKETEGLDFSGMAI